MPTLRSFYNELSEILDKIKNQKNTNQKSLNKVQKLEVSLIQEKKETLNLLLNEFRTHYLTSFKSVSDLERTLQINLSKHAWHEVHQDKNNAEHRSGEIDKLVLKKENLISVAQDEVKELSNQAISLNKSIQLNRQELEQKKQNQTFETDELNSRRESLHNVLLNPTKALSYNEQIKTFTAIESIENTFKNKQKFLVSNNPSIYAPANGLLLWFRKNILGYGKPYIDVYQEVNKLIVSGYSTVDAVKSTYQHFKIKNDNYQVQLNKTNTVNHLVEELTDRINVQTVQVNSFLKKQEDKNNFISMQGLEKTELQEEKIVTENLKNMSPIDEEKLFLDKYMRNLKITLNHNPKFLSTWVNKGEELGYFSDKKLITAMKANIMALNSTLKNKEVFKQTAKNLEKIENQLLPGWNKLNKHKSHLSSSMPYKLANSWPKQKEQLLSGLNKINEIDDFNLLFITGLEDFYTNSLSGNTTNQSNDYFLQFLLLECILNLSDNNSYQQFSSNIMGVPNTDLGCIQTPEFINSNQLLDCMMPSISLPLPNVDIPSIPSDQLALPDFSSSLNSIQGLDNLSIPMPSIDIPSVSLPDISISVPDVSISMPDISVSVPDFSSSMPDMSSSISTDSSGGWGL